MRLLMLWISNAMNIKLKEPFHYPLMSFKMVARDKEGDKPGIKVLDNLGRDQTVGK
jgi:hypothetical protein